MEELLLWIMEFSIELAVVTSALTLVTVGVSIALLYASGYYRSKIAAIIAPAVVSALIGVAGLENRTSVREWAYFALPSLILAPLFVSDLCYRKRLRESRHRSR